MSAIPDNIVVALVEDSENDIEIISRALLLAQPRNRIIAVQDGRSAIEYFQGSGRYADRNEYPLPGLVLLDLKLPMLDGFGVLVWIRQHALLKDLPVVVLTSSELLFDVTKAYDLGANSYLVKPL